MQNNRKEEREKKRKARGKEGGPDSRRGKGEQAFLRETTGNYSMLLGGGAVTAGGKTGVKALEKRRLVR